jgi:hypothetical protein
MNNYDRFLESLLAEFKLRAHPHLRSVWADFMELVEATHEPTLRAAREQARQRLLALAQAARAVNARDVQGRSQALAQLVTTVTSTRDVELFDSLYQKLRELTEALYAIPASPPASGHDSRLTKAELVESCVD